MYIRKSKWLIIIPVILLVGYFLYTKLIYPRVTLNPVTRVTNNTDITSVTTYTNTKDNYSIAVPSQMEHTYLEQSSVNILNGHEDQFVQGVDSECCGRRGPNLYITIFPEKGNEQHLDWAFEKYEPQTSDKLSTYTIAGTEVQRLDGLAGIRMALRHNGLVYKFVIYYSDPGDGKTDLNHVYDDVYRMIDSFQFLK